MKSVVGIFPSPDAATRAVGDLESIGISSKQVSLLTPGSTQEEIARVPTGATDGSGIGKVFGGLVGGTLAAAGGIHLGMAAASVAIPGVGPVVAIGLAAAALLGTAGALGGSVGGKFLEDSLNEDLPNDDLFLYEDALRKGRTLLVLQARDENQRDIGRQVMGEAGAKDLNSAREDWWLGVRSAEEQRYTPDWGDFEMDEVCYRMGFETAQRMAFRGKSYSTALNFLQKYHSVAVCTHVAFRRGYERGQTHHEALHKILIT